MNIYDAIVEIGNLLWGGTWAGETVVPVPPMTAILLGTGIYLMIGLKFMPIRRLVPAIIGLPKAVKAQGDGEITPWRALATALSGQIGTGNIVGVATALTLGGPGAIFWMWVTALIGMATAYAETALAVRYREQREDGEYHGGPMVAIVNGLGPAWRPLAILFCIGLLIGVLGGTVLIQSNSLVTGLQTAASEFGYTVPAWPLGLVVAALVFSVIIGGISSIGAVAGRLVPFVAAGYVGIATLILILNAGAIPAAFGQIFASAFGLESAIGGAAGYGVVAAIRAGVARGLGSNEAGLGTVPIVHAAAQTRSPAAQGELAMVGVFIDTMVVCTMTALVILIAPGPFDDGQGGVVAAAWASPLEGVELTAAAFGAAIPGGAYIVSASLALFAFTTLIGFAYYAEQALGFLAGPKTAMPFRVHWVGLIFVGSMQAIEAVWRLGDVAFALMALPNLLAVVLLSRRLFGGLGAPVDEAAGQPAQ
ncbi:MAG: amino acid carrier protein [Pseudomonadota bacterium]